MNDTLDAVEHKQTDGSQPSEISDVVAVTRSSEFRNDNNQELQGDEDPDAVPKERTSVIDMWRKREGAVTGSMEKKPSIRKISPNPRRLNQNDNNISLNDVKTSLAHQFHSHHVPLNQHEEHE